MVYNLNTMLVYMLFNEATEMAYIGQASKGLFTRIKEHVRESKKDSSNRLYRAIAEYGIESFTPVVLQNCYSAEELDKAERWLQLSATEHPTKPRSVGNE